MKEFSIIVGTSFRFSSAHLQMPLRPDSSAALFIDLRKARFAPDKNNGQLVVALAVLRARHLNSFYRLNAIDRKHVR